MGELFTLLLVVLFGLMPFIALMCIWSNTGKTAHLIELQWRQSCLDHKVDPKIAEKTLMMQ